MEKEFIPYEQALALKELGFDNTCHAYYSQYRNKDIHLKDLGLCNRLGISEENVLAPLYQQAFRFFREKYQLLHSITEYNKDGSLIIKIYQNKIVVLENMINFDITEYEEAELACIDKLIQIVKQKRS